MKKKNKKTKLGSITLGYPGVENFSSGHPRGYPFASAREGKLWPYRR